MVETMRMHPSLIVSGKDVETSTHRSVYKIVKRNLLCLGVTRRMPGGHEYL